MNTKFYISTDSTCDLYAEELSQMQIPCLPLTLTVGEGAQVRELEDNFSSYTDYLDFFKLLRSAVPVKSSKNNSTIHEEYFRSLAEKGYKKVLHFTISYALSNTQDDAEIAIDNVKKDFPDIEYKVVESHTTTVGQGTLVRIAYELQQKGATLQEAYDYVQEAKHHIQHFIMVDDLFHLKRGGRVSSIAAVVGTSLQIKIILNFDKEGKLAIINKIIGGRRRAFKQVSEEIKRFTLQEPAYLTVVHTDNEEGAKDLAEMLFVLTGIRPEIRIMGPTIGCHVGPNAVAYTFVSKELRPN